MWPKSYKDYPVDSPLKQEQVAPSQGIQGCEMHELNGWGNTYQFQPKKKAGFVSMLLKRLERYLQRDSKE